MRSTMPYRRLKPISSPLLMTTTGSTADTWPDAGLYCGRILPDWDGTEPQWLHDVGHYLIYPLPVPRFDQGDTPITVTLQDGPIPGGGNLVMRRHVFDLAGRFS